jgi:hypothetical protein
MLVLECSFVIPFWQLPIYWMVERKLFLLVKSNPFQNGYSMRPISAEKSPVIGDLKLGQNMVY